jgi:hypothetical protein
MLVVFVRRQPEDKAGRFNASVAFVAAVNLLFMILSKKSFNYYILMSLIFILHSVTLDDRGVIKRVFPLALLGAVTYLESYLWYVPEYRDNALSTSGGLLLLGLDVVLVGSYIYWLILCFRKSIHRNKVVVAELR